MEQLDWVEWLGYLASVIVLVSLTMASIVKLRWINLVGAGLYALYGVLIDAIPVTLLNLGIVFINLYYLYKYYTYKETFDVVEADMDSELFRHFLEVNREDIERFVPLELVKQAHKALWLLRDNNIAGIMVGDRIGDILDLKLDYVIPQYRDLKLGRYFFVEHPELFRERGIRKIFAHARDDAYRAYLEKIGFKPVDDKKSTYELVL
jgi:N-acetylglutamate synthase-like GNAT family acetyltransferase